MILTQEWVEARFAEPLDARFLLVDTVSEPRKFYPRDPDDAAADDMVEVTMAEVEGLLDPLLATHETGRLLPESLSSNPVVQVVARSYLPLAEKYLLFLASVPSNITLRAIRKTASVTEEVATRATLTYLSMCKDSRSVQPPFELNTPPWVGRLVADAVEEFQMRYTTKLMLRSLAADRNDLPLEVRAGLTGDWVYSGGWCEKQENPNLSSAAMLPEREAEIRDQYPDLVGLPGGLIVETLKSQEVTDKQWLAPVPDCWVDQVEEVLC